MRLSWALLAAVVLYFAAHIAFKGNHVAERAKTHGKGKCFSVRETTVEELYKILIAVAREKEAEIPRICILGAKEGIGKDL